MTEAVKCRDSVELVGIEFLCGDEGQENRDVIQRTMQNIPRGRQVKFGLESKHVKSSLFINRFVNHLMCYQTKIVSL